jgi:hypothetical protein
MMLPALGNAPTCDPVQRSGLYAAYLAGEVAETNGRRMAKGGCPVCGTRMNRMLAKA